ncbi:hypothetical protein BH20ACT5_BH20ACT5_18870 [soil metagenome]
MRTTVEITDAQHRALTGLAQQRRLRGFSRLVQEALDAYLQGLESPEIELLLSLEGSLDDDQERQLRAVIGEARATWRAS